MRPVGAPRFAAGLALALALAAPASAAQLPAQGADIFGVWMGIDPNDTTIPRQFRNTPWLPAPEFTAWGKAESDRWNTAFTPTACDPFNPAWFMNGSALFPIQILQGPNLIMMLYEATSTPRRIYTDGRTHPPDWDPTWLGHSVAHWEGDTLVIDTVGTNGRAKPINGFVAGAVNSTQGETLIPRLPASDQLHLVERLRVVGDGEYLEDDLTVTDLKTYTRAFSAKHYWRRRSDIDVQEYYCTDNERGDAEGQHPTPASAAR